jgi:hypothetical protein
MDAVCLSPCVSRLAIGYDEGTVVIKLGSEVPVSSMDTNTGAFPHVGIPYIKACMHALGNTGRQAAGVDRRGGGLGVVSP